MEWGLFRLNSAREDTRKTLGLRGDEQISIAGLAGDLVPLSKVPCTIKYANGDVKQVELTCRIDTGIEIDYVRNGGVLHYVLRDLAKGGVGLGKFARFN